MSDFLLEIGLEEIPARMIATAEAELGRRLHDLLTRERLIDSKATLTTFSTPRRIAVRVTGLTAAQADTREQLIGPSWKVAFKDDKPTSAAEAFAKKAGVPITALEKITNPKGEYVGATVERKGRTASDLLSTELPKEILAIYWAKNMYWRAQKPERFVRPVRWLVALLDTTILPLEIAGITATNKSRGHRILHDASPIEPTPVEIKSPAAYEAALKAAYVLVSVSERCLSIRKALDSATRTVPGARWREDEPLLETVVHLTEWPTALLGNFEPEYLALPEEVLVTVMRDHQKYFAVESADGKLAPHFLAVLNTEVDEEGRAIIRHGNARVLRARFKDAQFFWETDQKTPLTARHEMLKSVTFQKELGSYHWKTEENLKIAKALFAHLEKVNQGVPQDLPDYNALTTAVTLAKTDLTAELVKEFTELQGIIGGLYARAQGLGETVAAAIYSQYTPASTDDAIPLTIEGQLLGLADRIQTITAMFSIGNAPTGSKDPFALRRAANSIVKILAESDLPITLTELVSDSYGDTGTGQRELEQEEWMARRKVRVFLNERLHFYLSDIRGFAYDVVNAVLAFDVSNADLKDGHDDVRDCIARAEALTAVRGSADFVAISAAFKRIKNILRQAEEKEEKIPASAPAASALVEAEEKSLLAAATALAPKVAALQKDRNYTAALEAIATLRPAVDAFFDKVMVMAPEPALRSARLGLIQSVLAGFSRIADFSEIVTS
jgi:glycyl-tRNA synthetase beta chain